MTSGVSHAFQILAETVPLMAVVFVPAEGVGIARAEGSRVLWSAGVGYELAPGSYEQALGSAAASAAASSTPDDDSVVAVAITERDIAGTLVALHRSGGGWSDAERSLVRSSTAMLMPGLLEAIRFPDPDGDSAGEHASASSSDRLRSAAARGELVLLYQPEVDMRSGKILAVEALIRWDHPERGRLGPDAFIEQAEQSDVIRVLGGWVIDQALREFAGWHDDRVSLRINISPAQLSGEGVVDRLASALLANGVAGRQVCVEFTETASSDDPADLVATLTALASLGITSAIDDLATGYSTLARLRTLPVDTVKIDRSLVTGIDSDPRARAIVGALVQMATELGIETVSEGVETEAEARTLIALGCIRGQGHYFARPMEASAIPELLSWGAIPLS